MPASADTEVTGLIHTIRGEKVIIDRDLEEIYGVSTGRLNEAATRNADRFPGDFRFQLTSNEWAVLKSQFAIAKSGSGGRQTPPWVYTEHGAMMAANVLRSDRASQMSVFVVRALIKMRAVLLDTAALAAKLDKLEREVTSRLDSHEKAIVELMRQFLTILNPKPADAEKQTERREIGYHVKNRGEGVVSKSAR